MESARIKLFISRCSFCCRALASEEAFWFHELSGSGRQQWSFLFLCSSSPEFAEVEWWSLNCSRRVFSRSDEKSLSSLFYLQPCSSRWCWIRYFSEESCRLGNSKFSFAKLSDLWIIESFREALRELLAFKFHFSSWRWKLRSFQAFHN